MNSKEEYLKALEERSKGTLNLTKEERIELVDRYNLYTGNKVRYTSCNSCLRGLIKLLLKNR